MLELMGYGGDAFVGGLCWVSREIDDAIVGFDQHPSSWLVATSFVLYQTYIGFLPDMPCYLCTIQVTSENLPEKHAQQKSRLDEWVARSNSI